MGLIKTKILSNLDEITYFRIVRLNHVSKDGTDVVLGGFTSKAVSDQIGDLGIKHVDNFHFGLDKAIFISDNPYQRAYELIVESKLDEEGNETNFYADAESDVV